MADMWRSLSSILIAALILSTGTAAGAQESASCAKAARDVGDIIACAHDAVFSGAARCETTPPKTLVSPVAGRRVLQFEQPTLYGATSKGIVVETADDAAVRAPVSGTITFASEFRSYGKLLIIDACDVVVIVAGTGPFAVAAGQSVAAGDEVARMRQTRAELPVLYLEVRERGRLIDPDGLLADE